MVRIVKKKVKRLKLSYCVPTPLKIRKVSDSVLATMIFLSGYDIIRANNRLAITFLMIGGAAHLVSSLLADKKDV
jgi:hypothetical protein